MHSPRLSIWLTLFSGCFSLLLSAQNLVSGPGFEQVVPTLDSGNWQCILGTADYYNISNPERSTNRGLEKRMHAHGGVAYIGISCLGAETWGCKGSREFVSTRLVQPLEVGRTYEISLFVRLADQIGTFPLEEIGVWLSVDPPTAEDACSRRLSYVPLRGELPLLNHLGWMQVKAHYQAAGGEQFLTIGNFLGANLPRIRDHAQATDRSYYFIDDVSVFPVEPGKGGPTASEPPAVRETLPSQCTVYFQTNSSRLDMSEARCLPGLLAQLQADTSLRLSIAGHTDAVGGQPENESLAMARAQSLARFFLEKGIGAQRIQLNAYGSNRPAASNANEAGRALNRRAEARLQEPPLSEGQIEALADFARLYGYVRFFHPSEAVGRIDWNRFAAYGIHQIASSKDSSTQQLRLLRTLFYPLAPTLTICPEEQQCQPLLKRRQAPAASATFWQHNGLGAGGNEVYASRKVDARSKDAGLLFEKRPDDRIWKGRLPSGLYFEMPLVLPTDGAGQYEDSFYKMEQAMNRAGLTERDTRLANIIFFWNIIQHFYPYRECLGESWPDQLSLMLRTTEGIVSQPEFDRLFKSYAALLCDGHAGLVCEAELSYMWLPLELAWARGKLVVARSGAPEKVAAGDLLIRIDGADAVAQFHQDTALYSGSPQWKIARALENLGAGPQYSLVRLVMQRGRQFYKVELLRDWGSYPEARLIEQYAPGFFYINLKEIYAIDTLIACLPELAKAQGVIFDVRGYVKIRFSEFLPHLLPCADTVSNWIQSPQIVYPDWTEVAYQPEGWLLQPREPHIGARLVFLTDGRALSASESYLSFVRHYRLGTIIGSPTAGANGSRNWIGLLDGYILHWTGMQATLLDGAPLHCRGIMPDVSFVPSLKSLMEGRDELLEFARDFMAAEK